MAKVTNQKKKQALALAFGIPFQQGFITGIPAGVRGLPRALTSNDDIKLVKGLPVDFVNHMTDEQKKAFKAEIKRG